MRILLAGLAALTLAGCSGAVQYAMENYNDVEPVSWTSDSGTSYRIFNRPQENRLMITASLGAAAAQGLTMGLTKIPADVYESAAIEWLADQGRDCSPTETFLIMEPQYEVRYVCQ